MSDSAKQFLTCFTTPPPSFNRMFFLELGSGILPRKLQWITAECFAINCQQLPRPAYLTSGLGKNTNSKTSIAHLTISTETIYLSQDSKLFKLG